MASVTRCASGRSSGCVTVTVTPGIDGARLIDDGPFDRAGDALRGSRDRGAKAQSRGRARAAQGCGCRGGDAARNPPVLSRCPGVGPRPSVVSDGKYCTSGGARARPAATSAGARAESRESGARDRGSGIGDQGFVSEARRAGRQPAGPGVSPRARTQFIGAGFVCVVARRPVRRPTLHAPAPRRSLRCARLSVISALWLNP